MVFRFSERSERRLQGVHPDMVRVMRRALELSHLDFTVLEGLRSLERQHQLYAQGASTTMNSRHLTGHAVDIAPIVDGSITWHWPHYHELAAIVKQAATDCSVPLEWGGDWTSFQDGPHWQLPWNGYPADAYDASKASGASAAVIDAATPQVDSDAVVEEDRDRTGLAAAGATAAGGGVAASAALDLAENEGAAAAAAGDTTSDVAATDAESGEAAPSDVETPGDPAPAPEGPTADPVSGPVGQPNADAAGAADGAADAAMETPGLIARFIASENTLEIIALVLGGLVVLLGLYLLIRRIIRWSRKRRAAKRTSKVKDVLKDA